MSFSIDVTIPNAPNDPSDDQPKMKQNYANISGFLTVDHVDPGAPGNGFHKQVTYFTENTPAVPLDPTSVSFTANATLLLPIATSSATTIAQEFFRNANGIFPISCIRAFGSFVTTGVVGPITVSNGFNVNGISFLAGVYDVTLEPTSTNGNNVNVFITTSNLPLPISIPQYAFAAGVLSITFAAPIVNPNNQIINFLVIQV